MHDKPNLLSRMRNREHPDLMKIQDQDHPPQRRLLSRISQQNQTLSLLDRMTSPVSQQELPLTQVQESIKKFSSTVTPLSKRIEREKSPNQQYMLTSNRNLVKPLGM